MPVVKVLYVSGCLSGMGVILYWEAYDIDFFQPIEPRLLTVSRFIFTFKLMC